MQIGHPLLLFPLPLVLIYRAGQRLAKRKARKEKQVKSGFAAPMNAMPPTAGTQFFEVCLSAQPVGDFWIWSAVCDGQPPVLGELTALPGNSSLSAFSFVPCPARFLFDKTKRKCGGHSSRQSRDFQRARPACFYPSRVIPSSANIASSLARICFFCGPSSRWS